MNFIVIIVMVLWTTARHEASHALAAWLEGAEVTKLRLLPGVHPTAGFYFGYVEHSGETTWLTDAAPFVADAVVLFIAWGLMRRLRPGARGRFALVMLGVVSPLADLVYNYQGGIWREGTDAWDLFQALPNLPVHAAFLTAIGASVLLIRAARKQGS